MGRVTKLFHYPAGELATMRNDIGNWIADNSNIIFSNSTHYSNGIVLSHPSIDGIDTLLLFSSDVLSSNFVKTGSPLSIINMPQIRTASSSSDPTRTCQVTIYDNNNEDYIIVFGAYNNLDAMSSWWGMFGGAKLFFSGNPSALRLYDETGSNIGSVSALITNVTTPLDSMYICDAYMGTANAFNDIIVNGLKSYASDQTLQTGKRYIADGKTYLCLNSSARLLWEY